jgi:lysozyme family protein
MANFSKAIVATLVREGGSKITDDPSDRGGLTKYGISQRSYPTLDIRNLDEAKAREIYRRDYWDKVRADEIHSQRIADAFFDFAVNAGVRRAIKIAQATVGAKQDGIIGKITLAYINAIHPRQFTAEFTLHKISYYSRIVSRRPSQKRFLLGWINRSLEGFK